MLLFDIGWYCWLKKSLTILAFSKKLVTYFPLTNNLEIKRTFLPLTKVLCIDQVVFAEVVGSNNLADKQR